MSAFPPLEFAHHIRLLRRQVMVLLCLVCTLSPHSFAYSVLTHEEIIDLAWRDSIRPLLLSRYPGLTNAQLERAHAYAFGGSAIQDMGYYPFGHEFFSDLTHYVRAGDFVASLLRNAHNADEFAFGLGALSHYVGDSIGHQDAVNPSTGIEFPHLEKKYGPVVTYDEAPHPHVRTEFAFDVCQLSYHRLAPAAYLRHIGLLVPRVLLERAFFETYGLTLHSVLGQERPAIRSYRTAVRSFIPRFAYAENVIHRGSFPQDLPTEDFRIFEERLQQADFARGWNQTRKSPGITTHLLAILIRILPPIGKLSILAIRGPNEQTEALYVSSVNRTMDTYNGLLARLSQQPQDAFSLPNRDLDTGDPIKPGRYPLTDKTYARLLDRVVTLKPAKIPAGLRQDILAFYADPDAPITTKKHPDDWKRVQAHLAILRTIPGSSHVRPPPEPVQ